MSKLAFRISPFLPTAFLAFAAPAFAQTPADPATLLRKACVDTGMDAARLEQAARNEGWARLRITHVSGEPGRIDAFFAGGAQVMLTGGDAPEQATCAVMVDRPQGEWRAGLSVLAGELGLEPQPAPAAGDFGMWFAPGGYALSYNLAPGDRLSVSLSHAHVSTTTAGEAVVIQSERVEATPQ